MTGSKLFDLSGRTALVTGSSGGLGLAMARGLAEAGAAIVLNGRDETKLEATLKTFELVGKSALARAFDVADEAAVLRAFERFDAEGVSIDILVNNAGVQLRKPMLELSSEEWRRIVDTHLTAAFQIGREAARRMIARGKAARSSTSPRSPARWRAPTIAPYTAAKGGMKMLTRSMAAEWARHGIQANAIGPGYIVTEMNRALIEDAKFDAWVKTRTPSGRWGQPDDLIGVAVFLASGASDYVNGQIIYIDGGLLAVM